VARRQIEFEDVALPLRSGSGVSSSLIGAAIDCRAVTIVCCERTIRRLAVCDVALIGQGFARARRT